MTDHELLFVIYNDMQSMKGDVQFLWEDVRHVKKDVKHLKKEAVKGQTMDKAILDEVERVHAILERHMEDKAVHMA